MTVGVIDPQLHFAQDFHLECRVLPAPRVATASVGVSPESTFPPGNSHRPPRRPSSGRRAINSRGPFHTRAAAISRCGSGGRLTTGWPERQPCRSRWSAMHCETTGQVVAARRSRVCRSNCQGPSVPGSAEPACTVVLRRSVRGTDRIEAAAGWVSRRHADGRVHAERCHQPPARAGRTRCWRSPPPCRRRCTG